MKRTRRKFTSAFKANVALEAIKEKDSLAELSKCFEVHANVISKWKQEFLQKATGVFDKEGTSEEEPVDLDKIYAKIGGWSSKMTFLKKT